ncbi:hypothetical protein [Acidianus manzaensis]|uniref:Uncharacterized protein n=1 Tax=Acidianus manzaensis TaxID=282676 RepID=A0A1W6K0U1_9CREN|nr:hypothetical protein [Acidianus manzaensis]ARM76129.1 hypothetical protein B6F84_08925 [Acidianus manzaensis]
MLDVNTKHRTMIFLLLWAFSLIPISGYLFGNGYLNYGGPQFPFFSGYEVKYLYPLFVYAPETGISPSVESVLYLFMYLIPSNDVIILAKIYLILMFSVIYLILWKLTDLIIDVLKIHSFSVKILLILFFYLLPLYMQLIASNWFNVILGILSLSFVLINLINIQLNNVSLSKKTIILSGIALGFSAMMDPRFYIWFIYIISIFLLSSILAYRKSLINVIKSLLGIFLTSLPFVAYVYYIFIYPSLITTSIAEAASFSALRPDSLSYIAGFSQNSNFPNLFMFISSWWPSVIPSSPSILFYPRDKWFYLPAYGFNDQILMPNDPISYIWLSSLFIFIFIVFISIFNKSKRKISAELLLSLLFMIGVESGTNYPFREFTYIFDVLPSKLPIIGGIMSTAFAIPFYAEWTNVSISLILAAIGFDYIINTFRKIKTKYIIGIILVIIMSFASWQYFNGTLYPSQHTGSFPGNGVSLEGYYYPLNPPPQWVHIMNILSTSNAGVAYVGEVGFSEKWTNYQFISYSPPLMPGYATISTPSTSYVNQTPLAYEVAGIKYLFIDNTSYVPLSNSFIYSYLNHSGLKVLYANGDVYLLEQPNASIFREAKMGIFLNCRNKTVLFNAEWLLYPLLNYTPAIITPVKTPATVTMLLNPSTVNEDYISLFNESRNITILKGTYIINYEGNITRIDITHDENLSIKRWTIIIPSNVNLSDLVSAPINFSFNQLMAEFTVYSNKGYLVETSLPLPHGGIIVNNGKALGTNGFGQYIFTSDGGIAISIKLGFVTNLLITAVDIFFYLLFLYFIVYKSIFKINIVEVFRNAIIRISRLKSNK